MNGLVLQYVLSSLDIEHSTSYWLSVCSFLQFSEFLCNSKGGKEFKTTEAKETYSILTSR
jgi:hypothetical protein